MEGGSKEGALVDGWVDGGAARGGPLSPICLLRWRARKSGRPRRRKERRKGRKRRRAAGHAFFSLPGPGFVGCGLETERFFFFAKANGTQRKKKEAKTRKIKRAGRGTVAVCCLNAWGGMYFHWFWVLRPSSWSVGHPTRKQKRRRLTHPEGGGSIDTCRRTSLWKQTGNTLLHHLSPNKTSKRIDDGATAAIWGGRTGAAAAAWPP